MSQVTRRIKRLRRDAEFRKVNRYRKGDERLIPSGMIFRVEGWIEHYKMARAFRAASPAGGAP